MKRDARATLNLDAARVAATAAVSRPGAAMLPRTPESNAERHLIASALGAIARRHAGKKTAEIPGTRRVRTGLVHQSEAGARQRR